MSIYQRGNVWWCNFTVNGKRIQCTTGKTNRKDATVWEKEKIASLKGEESAQIAMDKIKRALVSKQTSFDDAWSFFLSYPRKRSPSAKMLKNYQSVYGDFCLFCKKERINILSLVDCRIATAYISHIRQHGRFSDFQYRRGSKKITVKKICQAFSNSTINHYLAFLKLFFDVMLIGKFILENPFAAISKMASDEVPREIFSETELQKLFEQNHHPLYGVLMVGVYTGLRLGDIARLPWSAVDMEQHWISICQHKTANPVQIPIVPPLLRFLQHLPRDGRFVLPELHDRYQRDAAAISKDFKVWLADIGVENATIVVEGRSRKVSVKDIHSLRHTFAYIAGKYGIPLHIVQSILGHMTEAMTRHYMAHATAQDKREAMQKLPDLFRPVRSKRPAPERFAALLDHITPENLERNKDRLRRILMS